MGARWAMGLAVPFPLYDICSLRDLSFFLVEAEAAEGLWSLSFIDYYYEVFLQKFMPSVFVDLLDVVNLCVVLAFPPKLPSTVLFNFPVLILNMLLGCPSSFLWNMPFQSISLSGESLSRCFGWLRVLLTDTQPWKVLSHWLKFLSSSCVTSPHPPMCFHRKSDKQGCRE